MDCAVDCSIGHGSRDAQDLDEMDSRDHVVPVEGSIVVVEAAESVDVDSMGLFALVEDSRGSLDSMDQDLVAIVVVEVAELAAIAVVEALELWDD